MEKLRELSKHANYPSLFYITLFVTRPLAGLLENNTIVGGIAQVRNGVPGLIYSSCFSTPYQKV